MDYDIHKYHEIKNSRDFFNKKGLSGIITNKSNKCYIISTLQCLSHTMRLTDELINNGCLKFNRNKQGDIVKSYYNLLTKLWERNQLVKSKTFIEKLGEYYPQYKNETQEDAHELFTTLCDIFEKALGSKVDATVSGNVVNRQDYLQQKYAETWCNYYKDKYSYFTNIFDGSVINEIKCVNCGHIEENFSTFNSLTIPVNKTISPNIFNCLDENFQDELINDWKCDKCSKLGCVKTSMLWSLPDYLVLHFSRFKHLGTQFVKDHDLITFDTEHSNFKKYVHKDKCDPNNYIYRVYAIQYHTGDMSSGHYYSAIRNIDGEWYLFNDGDVSKINNKKLVTKDVYMIYMYRMYIK